MSVRARVILVVVYVVYGVLGSLLVSLIDSLPTVPGVVAFIGLSTFGFACLVRVALEEPESGRVEQDPLEPDRFGRGALDAAPPERIQPRI